MVKKGALKFIEVGGGEISGMIFYLHQALNTSLWMVPTDSRIYLYWNLGILHSN